jgi:hypothetical protein
LFTIGSPQGLLKGKTRILVTHKIDLIPQCDWIAAMVVRDCVGCSPERILAVELIAIVLPRCCRGQARCFA